MTIQPPDETAEQPRCLAEATGRSLEHSVAELAADVAAEAEESPGAARFRHYRRRTPDRVEADRAEILRTAREARPLPPGKTLADVVQGTWPGDETEDGNRSRPCAVAGDVLSSGRRAPAHAAP